MISGLVRWFGGLVIAFALLLGIITGPSLAQSPTPTTSPDKPPQVREFLELLDDPAVRDWLETQRTANQAPPAAAPSEKARIEGYFGGRIATIRQHFASLAAAFQGLPADFEQARVTLRRGPSRARPDRNPAAPGRVRRAGLRCRMAVLAGDYGDAQADQRAAPRHGGRPAARDRDAARVRRGPGCRFCLR